PWHGAAADEFRWHGTDLPDRLATHRDSTGTAADVLFDWSGLLADLRRRAERLDQRAREIRSRLADADQAVEEWETAVSVASSHTRQAAEATLAEHRLRREAVAAERTDVLVEAHRLAAEHRAAAARTTALLRALASTTPAADAPRTTLGSLLTGLSGATRAAGAVAGLAGVPGSTPPPAGAVAVAMAPPDQQVAGSWMFGPAVPVDRLVAGLTGRRRDTTT
ncbi:MAG TPA: hypothetical protein VHV49_19845, partial [Pseudonocardiaceae bacterium]|nr:hypothetical protein [Pseudonocardiaceae bacterium]